MMGFSIPDIWEEEVGGSQVWGQLELHGKALSQKYKKKVTIGITVGL